MPGFTDTLKLIGNDSDIKMTAKQLINSILVTFTFETNIITNIILKPRKLKILCIIKKLQH